MQTDCAVRLGGATAAAAAASTCRWHASPAGACSPFGVPPSLLQGGHYNEAEAYMWWNRAVLEYLKLSGRQPDVLHVHEWQAAAVPMLFWEAFNGDFPRCRLLLTIQ